MKYSHTCISASLINYVELYIVITFHVFQMILIPFLFFQTAYTQRDDVYKFLRKVFALPFLPADHILDTFTLLQQKAVGEQLQSVMQYVNDTWMQSTVWPISSWSVFGRSVRTNNDTEGWHHHLNHKARKVNLPFYVLLKLLTRQALAIPLQVKLVSEGKLRRTQRKKTRETQGKLFALWKQYADNNLSVSRLLKKCGAIYGPTV